MAVIIIFYILLVGLIAFLQWKVSLLRRGKIEIQTIHKDKSHKIKILRQIMRYFGHILKDWLKDGFIKFASWRIRSRARLSYFTETKLPWLYTLLTKRPDIEAKHTKNIFWRGVIEYKYKLQKLKAQILEEEGQKITDREIEKANEKANEKISNKITENIIENIKQIDIVDTPKKIIKLVPENEKVQNDHLQVKPLKPKKPSIIKRVVKKVRKII